MMRMTVGTLRSVVRTALREAVHDASISGRLDAVRQDEHSLFPPESGTFTGTKAMVVRGKNRIPVIFTREKAGPGARITMLIDQRETISGSGYFRDDVTYITDYEVKF